MELYSYRQHNSTKRFRAYFNETIERLSHSGKPIYLMGDLNINLLRSRLETNPSNYRPSSLLSIFNRLFEKMMYSRIKGFIDKHNVLYHSQYGFREKHSTQHAILDIVNQIQTQLCL